MEIRPILSAMLRNKTGAVLVAMQIAITLAIVCNAVFIIHDRLTKMHRTTGFDIDNIFLIAMRGYTADYNPVNGERTHLDLLRGLPGVVDATNANEIPLSGGGWDDGMRTKTDLKAPTSDIALYHVDEHGINALGVKLVEGRNFTHDEIEHVVEGPDKPGYQTPSVGIISRETAEKMFPGQDPLGKTIYDGDAFKPITVIGMVDRMEAAWPHCKCFEDTMLVPTVFDSQLQYYLVRTLPGQRDQVMKDAEKKLGDAGTGAFVRRVRTLDEYRRNTYEEDNAMSVLLTVVTSLILTITALGIVGLASFSVRQRTKQIGTRRALGATRRDIVRYFMTENWLITSIGVTLGAALAVALNFWLVNLYSIPPISWYYIPVGILCLWVLGLLAVLGPALKAATIPPAIATRSV